jgi:poly(A) polymerase
MHEEFIFSKIYELGKKMHVSVYAVGGYVRDTQMSLSTSQKDIDFVVLGSGLAFAQAFSELLGEEAGSLVEFPDFDTARFVFAESNGIKEVEFAGARRESYQSDSRKPQVEAAGLVEDLARRDFTVNAMAREVVDEGLSAELVDPFDGSLHIQQKILCTPLDPDETFSEDPLRMLRAARFAAQLGFAIAHNTYTALAKNAHRLKIISAERIKEELMKLLATPVPSVGLYILHETKLFMEFLPEVSALEGIEDVYGHQHKDNLSHSFKVVDNVAVQSNKPLLRYAGLVHDIAKPATKKFVPGRGWTFDMHEHLGKKMVRDIGRRLRLSKDETEYVAKLVRWHLYPIAITDDGVTDAPVRRLIVNAGDDLADLLILCRADITTGNPTKKTRRLKNYDMLEERIIEVTEKDKLRAFQSPVRGEEIMQLCGLKPGPTVGKIKKALEDAILDGAIPNEYDATKAYFEHIKDTYLTEVADWEKL